MTDFAIEELFEGIEEDFTKKEPPVKSHNPVNKPVHYNQAGIECIEAIRAMTYKMDGTSAYMAGNVLKYVWRHEYKNGLEDLEKAQVYLGWLIDNYKEKHK